MAKSKPKEAFVPEHKNLDDDTLLEAPQGGPLTPLTLFVCTYVATLSNLKIDFRELTRRICEVEPDMPLPEVAFNSNFGHRARPGYEKYLKVPKAPDSRTPFRGRPRKVQGDGTCFNSAIEPILVIEHPGVPPDKVYKVKCFPTTGATQVPGVICPDLSDGHEVLRVFVDYLNTLAIGVPDEHGVPRPVAIAGEGPKMINYKFRVVRSTPRMLIDLQALSTYMVLLENTQIAWNPEAGGPPAYTPSDAHIELFSAWPALVPPPYLIRETKPPTDDVKMSFRFAGKERYPRVNVFQEGKINILGADTFVAAERIYIYFKQLFEANWPALVCLQPRRDNERYEAAPAVVHPTERTMASTAISDLEKALVDLEGDDALDSLLTECYV